MIVCIVLITNNVEVVLRSPGLRAGGDATVFRPVFA